MAHRLACLVAGLLLALSAVGIVDAAEVRVVRATFESKFPQAMTFTLDATASRPIRRVTIWYRVAGKRTLVSSDAELAQAGGTLRAQQAFDLARDYVPPGTSLEYYWELQDDQGVKSRTDTFQTTVEDRRFQWKQLRAPTVQVEWYTGDESYGRAVMGIATRALGQIASDLGVTLDKPVRILIYSGRDDFQSASYHGGLEWVGGTYYPEENVILVFAPPGQQGAEVARRAIPHELTHAVIHQVTDNPFGDVPQWLNEGLATRSEGNLLPDHVDALARANAQRKLISLRALSGAFPVDADEATLAYAESYSAVTFLLDRYGRPRVNHLLQTYREGVTYDDGLRRVLGVDQTQLDQEWRGWLAPWPFIKASPLAEPPPPEPPTLLERLVSWLRGALSR